MELNLFLEHYPLTFLSMHALCTTSSIKSVVTPGTAARAAISNTSRANRPTFLMPSCCFLSKISILFLPPTILSDLGIPSLAYSGWGIDVGMTRRSDNGYSGRNGPVKSNAGNGLKMPVFGSGVETTLGFIRLFRKLLCAVCTLLCLLCRMK